MLRKESSLVLVIAQTYFSRINSLFRIIFCGLFSLSLLLSIPVANAGQGETAKDLTTLLRAARAVTANKTTIADPSKFNLRKFIKKTKKNYLRASGQKLDKSNVLLSQMLQAIKQVITDAKAGKYSTKWPSGDYANKFLPARFAREAGVVFEKLSGGKGSIKLTTSNALLVNSDNKADAWESSAIESKFLTASWERNKVISEKTSLGFRLILPEYFKSGCLRCHGGEQGKKIHAGRKSGNLGDFGGAISVILK